MRRAKAHLDPEQELRLRLEAAGGERSVVSRTSQSSSPPGAGAFGSGRSDTPERAEEILPETGFGRDRDLSDARALAENWQRRLAGKISGDSSDLIREDRER